MRTTLLAALAAVWCLSGVASAGETRPLPVQGLNERLDEIVVKHKEKVDLVDEANKRQRDTRGPAVP